MYTLTLLKHVRKCITRIPIREAMVLKPAAVMDDTTCTIWSSQLQFSQEQLQFNKPTSDFVFFFTKIIGRFSDAGFKGS